jgi:hypothetical protein
MNSKQINDKVKNIGKLMSLESKINVVGSANVKRNLYYSDYDLFEDVRGKSEQLIYNHFRALFDIIKTSNNSVITDFKCGLDNKNNPLRWDHSDIMKGENNDVSFFEAVRHKSIIKLDIIMFINSRFIEISEVFQVYLNGESNMDYSTDEVMKELTVDYKDYVKEGNYMKALKRMFSIIKMKNPQDKKLVKLADYFNSPIGLLYRCKSDLETIDTILYYNKFGLDQVRDSLQMLKEVISAFDVQNDIESISLLKSKDKMRLPLKKQIIIIKDFVNRNAKKFLASSNV